MQLALFAEGPSAPDAAAPQGEPAPALPRSAAPAAEPAPALQAATFRHPEANREIVLDEHCVGYALRRARRRSIGFIVGSEGLSVNAPKWVGIGDIEDRAAGQGGVDPAQAA